jgi:integrase
MTRLWGLNTMALSSRTFRLESREERAALQPRVWPYWWHFGRGRHLGYLPSPRGNGSWHARYAWRDTSRTRHRQLFLGRADDYTEADGVRVLSFQQAWEAAKKWVAANADKAVRADFSASPDRLIYLPIGDVYTVGHAVLDYIRYSMMYRKAPESVMYKVNRYILPHLGTIAVDELTSEQLREWLEMVAKSPAQRGTGRPLGDPTPEDRQRRRHTANAIFATLTAALNQAFRDGKIASDTAWRRVPKYRDLHRVRVRYLLQSEARALIGASPPDFRDLVLGALYTGCRAGELIAMPVGAFNVHTNRLYVAPGKSNWARWLALPDEGIDLFRRLSQGRSEGEPMFLREDGTRWKIPIVQACMVQARKKAGLDSSVVFHTLRHTYASYLVMGGASLLAVMKLLGHADIRLVVLCYAHLSPDFLADSVRLHFPKFIGARSGQPGEAREWREVATALRSKSGTETGPQAAIAPPGEVADRRRGRDHWVGDPALANPAAVAARRWAAGQRRDPPEPMTYERLAGKV